MIWKLAVIGGVAAVLTACGSSSSAPTKSTTSAPPTTRAVAPTYAPLSSAVNNVPGKTFPFGGVIASQSDSLAAGVADVQSYSPDHPTNSVAGDRAVRFTVQYLNNTKTAAPVALFTPSLTVDGQQQAQVIDRHYEPRPSMAIPAGGTATYAYDFYAPTGPTTATLKLSTVGFSFVFEGAIPATS